ncbi:PEPxxWA-CTERM sorting domain-containing protein [Phenylobacterium sp.]|uniref:PEPxxWA-CTERM sorting domain-containing protein n=1 Tax=Phenylobacterium sp. TaxID=1871053 RepID=UPI0025F358D6|nr:PEPxxWA-CTERM sorting domain-containing protein [Phenylobacterium sp.]MBX3482254.1 PEP-CTERM sorting domain-containing protein [Phenylobacterium sp.]
MLRKLSAAAIAAAFACPASAMATTWDAFDLFDGSNPTGVFRYVGFTGPIGQNPSLMATDDCPLDTTCLRANPGDSGFFKAGADTPATIEVDDGSILTVPTGALIVQPGDFGAAVFFNAPHAGTYRIKAVFNGAETLNDGVTIASLQSLAPSVILGTANTTPNNLVYDGRVTLGENQFFAFFVGPGLAAEHDLTSLSFRVIEGVPEPGAWALMIMGFGGVGAALRRRAVPA